jgi:hypothetical protein
LSRRPPAAIFSAVRCLQSPKNPIVAAIVVVLSIAIVTAPWPRARASGTRNSQRPPIASTSTHFLRDAVPAAGFAAAPEDTTDEDEFLPEEEDTSKLVWDIAAWVVGAAIVAFFIIKVFIEEDQDEEEGGGGTKPDPF